MALTLGSFRARFPEFGAIADATVQVYIDDALADLEQGIWGSESNADRATAFLAAHRLATELDSAGGATTGQVGALASATADGVSSTYVMPEGLSGDDLALWSTAYGQRFLDLRRRYVMGFLSACS